MPSPPHRPRALQWRVFQGTDAVRRRLLTVDQLRSSAWVRVGYDGYADARLDRDHRLVCEAAALWLPAGAAIAGPSAAYLHGVEHAARFTDDLHILTAPEQRITTRRGLRIHRARLAEPEIEQIGQIRRTTAVRTAWDLACWLDLVPAVTIIDGLLRTGSVASADLARLVAERTGQRGARRAAHAFDLSDGRAESPPESQLRTRLILAGLPRPVPQHPVRLPNGSVYHPDLPWPDYRVAVEYDGAWHSSREQLRRDRQRLNHLVAAGWIILHATSQHLGGGFWDLVRQSRDALRARGWRGWTQRAHSLDAPPSP